MAPKEQRSIDCWDSGCTVYRICSLRSNMLPYAFHSGPLTGSFGNEQSWGMVGTGVIKTELSIGHENRRAWVSYARGWWVGSLN